MADLIRPSDLVTERTTPVASEFMVVDNGVTVAKSKISDVVAAGRPLASKSEAEAGTDALKTMTPLTTKQAVTARIGVDLASKAQGDKADTALQSVVGGTNVTVNNADPKNPIVSVLGTGDVVGPASAVDERIAVYDGTTGKLIKDGGKTIGEVMAPMTGDSGTGGTKGLVPAPGAGDAMAGKVLGASGYWILPTASGGSSAPSLRQRVVDFHFGCTRGVGFINGVDSGVISFTLSSPAAAGAMTFAYTGTAPGTSQLIVLLGDDSEYYTVVAAASVGGTCSLLEPLPCAVSAGANAWSFWDTDFHPNAKGYAALADHALRQGLGVWKKIYQRPPRVKPSATVVANTTNAFGNPGSASSGYGWTATPSGAGGGAYWEFVPPQSGVYRLSFQCSKVTTATADIVLTITCDGTTVATKSIKTATAGLHEVDFYAAGNVAITLTRTANAFLVSDMSIFSQEEASMPSVDYGSHMVFGDSWVFDPVGPAARITTRLPSATISKSGVGGNKASDLVARFDADVAAAGPFDFVWVIVGANDISAGITAPAFAANIATLINQIQGIGAIPILFTPYPGSTNYTSAIDLARVYMANVPFNEQNARKVTRYNIQAYCGAGGDGPVLSLGIKNDKFRVVGSYLNAATNFKEGGTQPATSTLVAVPSGLYTTPIDVVPNPAGRFVQLIRTTGGSLEVVVGYIDIEESLGG